jgi:MFS family permease
MPPSRPTQSRPMPPGRIDQSALQRPERRARPWLMLTIGVAAQAAGTLVVSTPAFLIPLLHTERGLSLVQGGLLASAPTLGMVLTLVAWGAVADRFGERWVLSGGLVLTALATTGAAVSGGYLGLGGLLLLCGMAAASTNAASGRVVIGWFPARRRGLAMGIRQMSQPLGVAVAALVVPPLAASGGVALPLLLGAVLTLVCGLACAVWIINPPRTAGAGEAAPVSPYRASGSLWRIHAASMLLVIPQFTLSTFGLVWLIVDRGWSATAAGVLVGVSQFAGALGRIGVGMLSDRVGSRLRPLRWVAAVAALAMGLLAATGLVDSPALVAIVFLLASCITVADNGLAYTAVAEIAGSGWSGRALGAQNTGQFLAASAVGPGIGALIALLGFPLAFLSAALAPLAAIPLVPPASAEQVDR